MPPAMDSESLEMVIEAFRDYAAANFTDSTLLEWDEKEIFPLDVIRDMCGEGLGIQLLFIEEEYGGMGGGAFDVYRLCEEVARVDLGIATGVLATFLGSDPIKFGGTEEQRMRWMSQIAEEGLLMAYGATEPAAGSDLGAMRTVAEHVIEDGKVVGYSISGNKQWISNGGHADLYTILANAPGGPCWFVMDQGTKGFTPGKPEDKHGIRSSNTAALTLENVFVEADRLVGGVEGQGLLQAQMVFGYTRLMVAAFGLGGGWAALDRAITYSTERIQTGTPLSEKQGFTHKLIIPHVARLEASRAYIEDTAERIDSSDETFNTEGAIAKYLATEAGNDAADAAIQALGGYGYSREYMVEKIRRDVRITTIYEGTSEIMEMTIARGRWKNHLLTRGQYYRDEASSLEALALKHPTVGADIAALTLRALAEVLEQARTARLTRQQHLLMRLGQLIGHAEGAAVFARRSAKLATDDVHSKAHRRFGAEMSSVLSRIYARETAHRVATDGMRWVLGAAETHNPALAEQMGLTALQRAQVGLVADMDRAADLLYDRA